LICQSKLNKHRKKTRN